MALSPLSACFQSLPLLPTRQVGPSSADSHVGKFVYILGPCWSLQGTLLWGWEFLTLTPQLPQAFSISGLRLYFPALEPWCFAVCFATPLFFLVYLCANVGLTSSQAAALLDPPAAPCPSHSKFATSLGPPATALPWVLSTQLHISTPPTSLDEYVFVNSLVVRLPYCSILCQLWLFFVFKLLLSFCWLCKGGTMCLPTPPSWLEVLNLASWPCGIFYSQI